MGFTQPCVQLGKRVLGPFGEEGGRILKLVTHQMPRLEIRGPTPARTASVV